MDKCEKTEKNRDRVEERTAYATSDIEWLPGRENWPNIASIGAFHTCFDTPNGGSDEWHYYISSMKLSAEALLSCARKEWSVETMHFLLDVRFGEDFFRAHRQNAQENMNIIRKMVLNLIRAYKNSKNDKSPFSGLMLGCLLDPGRILKFLYGN
jgi:predicted transposase YbfD/YdcC